MDSDLNSLLADLRRLTQSANEATHALQGVKANEKVGSSLGSNTTGSQLNIPLNQHNVLNNNSTKVESDPNTGEGREVSLRKYRKLGVESYDVARSLIGGGEINMAEATLEGARLLRGLTHVIERPNIGAALGILGVSAYAVAGGLKAAELGKKGQYGEAVGGIIQTGVYSSLVAHALKESSTVKSLASAGISITGATVGVSVATAGALIYLGHSIYDAVYNREEVLHRPEERKQELRNDELVNNMMKKTGGHRFTATQMLYETEREVFRRENPWWSWVWNFDDRHSNNGATQWLQNAMGIGSVKVPRKDMEARFEKGEKLLQSAYAKIGTGDMFHAAQDLYTSYDILGKNREIEPSVSDIWHTMDNKRTADRNFARYHMARMGSRAGD